MSYLQHIRELNLKLNDLCFPRTQSRYTNRFRELVRSLSEEAGVVLHLGAGRVDLEPFARAQGEDQIVINLDLNREELKRNPGKIRLCANAEILPLPPSSVDLVCSEHVWEHFARPLVSLRECFRVLRPGGKLIVSGPNGWSYIALAARATPQRFHDWVRRWAAGSHGEEANGFPVFYRFSSPGRMHRMARKAGLSAVSFETFVGEPCYTTFLPLVHLVFIAYHLLLERLRPALNSHVTSVAVFQKPSQDAS